MLLVYAIYNPEREKIYIGQTADIAKRLARHNGHLLSKNTSYTKKLSGQWILVYDEPAADRTAAKKREKELKSAKGREFVWSIINKDFSGVRHTVRP